MKKCIIFYEKDFIKFTENKLSYDKVFNDIVINNLHSNKDELYIRHNELFSFPIIYKLHNKNIIIFVERIEVLCPYIDNICIYDIDENKIISSIELSNMGNDHANNKSVRNIYIKDNVIYINDGNNDVQCFEISTDIQLIPYNNSNIFDIDNNFVYKKIIYDGEKYISILKNNNYVLYGNIDGNYILSHNVKEKWSKYTHNKYLLQDRKKVLLLLWIFNNIQLPEYIEYIPEDIQYDIISRCISDQ